MPMMEHKSEQANWWREIIAIPLTNIAIISNFISGFPSEIF